MTEEFAEAQYQGLSTRLRMTTWHGAGPASLPTEAPWKGWPVISGLQAAV